MRLSASKIGLALHCGYFARPEAEWDDRTSAAAERGTRFHAAIATYIETGEFALADTDGDIIALCEVAQAWVDHFGRDKLAAEVAFAWDPVADTAEIIGHNIGREYGPWQARGLLCGTADIVAVSRVTRTGYVGDWSTGDGSMKGPQLRSLAVSLARVEGLDMVTVEALEVTADGVRHVCTETLDAFALAAVAGEQAEALAAVPTAEPKPGDHCSELYCPARVTCPAGRAVIAEVIPAEALVRHRWGTVIQSPDHAAWLLAHARLVEAAAKAVKEAVKEACPPDGWILEDGGVLVEGSRNMPRFDVDKLKSLARAAGVTDEDMESCSYVAKESAGLKIKKPEVVARPRKKRAA